ncbi:D-alanine--D-alanine ligase [Corallococcus sp. H22C18031201]|uniref:D-alanine--D-alanine ligase family protein n=1 Tax=Citreicoccus inhibens TaxID=2849499 RepID=UPI000E737A3B|nr:ATP-grasp domain-containing protein [Citreicoccus inhibens]MBU8896170.1 ATP-grasp domain-containing protein [Citreicoccus inhibens]RJS26029.1 D-alanine--D-alanine ligase [Corallococcus sp. H22C18031201]
MHIALLHNRDHELLEDDPGREAREDVVRVAESLSEALTRADVTAEPLAIEGDRLDFVDTLRRLQPDLVVNLCESLAADSRGEMAVPCLLDALGLPYTGSSALSLGLALHKPQAKELLRAHGVSTPASCVVRRLEDVLAVDLPWPLIVKPSREDASVGMDFDSVVQDRAALARACEAVLRTFHQPALVEQFIPGREVYVPLLGNHPRQSLPLTEIHFGDTFQDRPNIVSYRAKWEADSPEFRDSPTGPCQLDAVQEARCVQVALEAFAALECQDYGRVDLRVSPEGIPYVIDINPNCDLHPSAGFAKAAASAGMDYPALASRLVEIALERAHGHPTHRRKGPGAARRADPANRNLLAAGGGVRHRAG